MVMEWSSRLLRLVSSPCSTTLITLMEPIRLALSFKPATETSTGRRKKGVLKVAAWFSRLPPAERSPFFTILVGLPLEVAPLPDWCKRPTATSMAPLRRAEAMSLGPFTGSSQQVASPFSITCDRHSADGSHNRKSCDNYSGRGRHKLGNIHVHRPLRASEFRCPVDPPLLPRVDMRGCRQPACLRKGLFDYFLGWPDCGK